MIFPITDDYQVLSAIIALLVAVCYTLVFMKYYAKSRKSCIILIPGLAFGNAMFTMTFLGLMMYAIYRKQRPAVKTVEEIYANPYWWIGLGVGFSITLLRIFTWN